MKKIAILICYYGKFPWYFRYFLHSCSFNKTIDFYIFTDIIYEGDIPQNVKLIKKSVNDIKALASEKLGFEVNIEFPYKFCDYKPAYGAIFSDYIEDYDFWGQSDIDIIYGDIRGFITDDMLNEYDFISVRHDYTTGCFALYRNNDLMNTIFKRSKDYKTVFTTSPHYCFDECSFVQDLLTEGRSIFDIETRVESFTHIIKAAEAEGQIKAHFDFILMEGVPGRITFDKGRIIYKKQYEAILYHLYWLKRCYNPQTEAPIPDVYHISAKRIYTRNSKKHLENFSVL